MSNLVTSWLRTVVPGLWSAAVTALLVWLGANAPWVISVLDALNLDLESPTVAAFVMAAVLAGWHALFRKVEPHLPDWLTRLVLGSAAVPLYVNPVSSQGSERLSKLPRSSRVAAPLDADDI